MMMIAVGGRATRQRLVAYDVFRSRHRRRRVVFCKILIEIDIVHFLCAEWLSKSYCQEPNNKRTF